MGKSKVTTYALVTAGIILTPCARAELVEINRVLAKVEDRIVTQGEINKAMDLLDYSPEEKKLREKEFVDAKIDRLLAIASFHKKGMNIPEAFLESEYNKRLIRDFNGDRVLFRDVLRSNSQSQLEYRKDLEEEIIHGHMLSARRRSREEVSPEKVEQFYKANQAQYVTEGKIRLREIIFSQIAGEPEAVLLQQAREALDKIKAGEKFEDLAKTLGQSPNKSSGGDWGVLVAKREIRNEALREKAFALKEGEVSDPILIPLLERKPDGTVGPSGKRAVYLLKVDKKQSAGVKPLDEVRQEIEKNLASQLEGRSRRQWLARLRENAHVKYYFKDDPPTTPTP